MSNGGGGGGGGGAGSARTRGGASRAPEEGARGLQTAVIESLIPAVELQIYCSHCATRLVGRPASNEAGQASSDTVVSRGSPMSWLTSQAHKSSGHYLAYNCVRVGYSFLQQHPTNSYTRLSGNRDCSSGSGGGNGNSSCVPAFASRTENGLCITWLRGQHAA